MKQPLPRGGFAARPAAWTCPSVILRAVLATALMAAALPGTLVVTGCSGGGGTPSAPGSINGEVAGVTVAPGGSGVFLAGATQTGTGAAPQLNTPAVTARPGSTVTFNVTAPTPLTELQIAGQNLTGYYDVQISSTGQQGATQTVQVTLTVAQNVSAGQFLLQIITRSGGVYSQPASLTVTISNSAPGGFPRSVVANWTVLVYMNAANNLEPYSLENMDQMEQAPYSSNVNVVVEWKRWHTSNPVTDDAQFDASAPEFDGTRRYWLTGRGNGQFEQDRIGDLGSGAVGSNPATADLGSYQALSSFLSWGKQNFPAQHYLLVIWNHGAGWEHRALVRAPAHRGISYDDQSGHSIETWQLSQALSTLAPFDVLAMDASLMQMLEVDYEIRNDVTYVVGSEDSPPGDGYPYQIWLPALTRNPSLDPLSLAKSIADTFASFYANHTDSSGFQDSVTQSVVKESAVQPLAQAVSNLGQVLYNDRVAYAQQFATARDSADPYAAEDTACTGGTCYPEFKDLVQYVTLLEQKAPQAPGLNAAAEAVKSAVSAAVLDNQATLLDATDSSGNAFSHGISIYVPLPPNAAGSSPPQTYDSFYYPNLAFAKDTAWPLWLANQKQ